MRSNSLLSVAKTLGLLKKSSGFLFSINKKMFIFTIIYFIFNGFYSSINVILFRGILNNIQGQSIVTIGLINYLILYFFLASVNIILSKLNEYVGFKYKNRISLEINTKILKKTSEMDLNHFENTEIYNLIQKADEQSNDTVYTYFINALTIFSTVLSIASNGLILLFWKWQIFVLIMSLSMIRAYVLSYFGKENFNLYNNRVTDDRKKWYFSYILKNEFSFKEIKIYKLHKYFLEKYTDIFNDFFKQDRTLIKKKLLFDTILSFMSLIIMLYLFLMAVFEALSRKILVGTALSYIQSGTNIRNSSEILMSSITTLTTQSLFLSQLFQFFEISFTNKSSAKKVLLDDIHTIELINVSFSRGNKKVLKDINITMEKGNVYSIVGVNGAGKTTLVRIILGLYLDYEGTILVNNIDLRTVDLDSYWSKAGAIFQDFNKYELTLRENIINNQVIKDSDVKNVLYKLDEKFSNKIDLDSQLGYWFDDGTQLSGGEWVKVGISRALVRKPKLLVADEPNASLDNISQQKLNSIIGNYSEANIVIFVSHRIKNLKDLDSKIILIDEGYLIDKGSYEELCENNLFNRLLHAEN
ncbi:ATP-binding cassette domain-containing protein [Enterococcus innesii]|mgnify:CR=1 FL=1|uniref:ATP-binding cassette domain-containing protein n=2 Tax=Enterococcus innesii TaxID=2839759 RepID=UPI003DA3C318